MNAITQQQYGESMNNEPQINDKAPVQALCEVFWKSGLVNEFFEILINDFSIPSKLRRQVWVLCSTEWDERDNCIRVFAHHFESSTDELSQFRRCAMCLTDLWQGVVDDVWQRLPDMPLKQEVDKMPNNDWVPE